MLNITLVFLGIGIFLFSLYKHALLLKMEGELPQRKWWWILLILVIFFTIGYIVFAYWLINRGNVNGLVLNEASLHTLISFIFFFGAIFVVISISLIYSTLNIIIEQTRQDRKRGEEQHIIFDSIPAWIFYKDRENRFIYVNKAFAEVMGKTDDELEGKSLFDVFPKEQAEAFWKDDSEVISSGKPKRNIIEPMNSKKGPLWVQTDKIPYRDAKGNIIGIIGFSIDITEQRKIEEEVKKRAKELERANSLMVGRELKMAELKKENERLKADRNT
jgi:PAS domain S-box-containing protein